MKYRNILFASLLLMGSLPLKGLAQQADRMSAPAARTVEEVETSTEHKRAWEIGVGGSLVNWTRMSLSGFQRPNENYLFNLKEDHLMGGPSLYIARELNRWFYLDLQGTAGIARKREQQSGRDLFYMGGLGLQWRLSPLFKSKYVEPYLRVGVNYLHKNFASDHSGKFANDPTGEAGWSMSDRWNSENVKANKNNFVPISLGVGVNAWLNNSLGLGIQAEYLLPTEKNLPKFAQVTGRIMWRIGGRDKRTRVRVTEYVPVEKTVAPVAESPERIREVMVHDTVTVCRLLNTIHFDFDEDLLNAENSYILDELAKVLLKDQNERYLLIGHTDASGNDEYNADLSNRRAKAVYDALIKRGVPSRMLKWRGTGKCSSFLKDTAPKSVRKGDRKVTIERIIDRDYWNAL